MRVDSNELRTRLAAESLAPRRGVLPALERLGAVQIDPIAIVAPNHQIVLAGRLGRDPCPSLEALYRSGRLLIGDSPAAPRFNIISKPNDWTKAISRAARRLDEEGVSETKAQQLRYWQGLKDLLESERSAIKCRTPRPQHWTTFSIGRSGFQLSATVNTVENRISTQLFINDENAKTYFALLRAHQAEIEAAVGLPLSWQELPDRIGSRIALYKKDADPTAEADWPNQHQWIADNLQRLDRVFRTRVRNLELPDAREEAESAQ
jgi:hypothetical protein